MRNQNSFEQQVTGIIIRTYPFSEADLILRIISAQGGKISGLAKHARKGNQRRSTNFDLFDCGIFMLKQTSSDLWQVKSFSSLETFTSLRSNLEKLTAASLVCEAFDYLTHDQLNKELITKQPTESSSALYDLLKLSLNAIDQANQLNEILKAVFITVAELLNIQGFGVPPDIGQPSTKNLAKLLNHLESSSGRILATRPSLATIIAQLKHADQ